MSTKAQRVEKIHTRMWEYARSGDYRDWLSIETALRQQGLHEARSELDRRHIREQLDATCKIALDARARGITYEQALREKQGDR